MIVICQRQRHGDARDPMVAGRNSREQEKPIRSYAANVSSRRAYVVSFFAESRDRRQTTVSQRLSVDTRSGPVRVRFPISAVVLYRPIQ